MYVGLRQLWRGKERMVHKRKLAHLHCKCFMLFKNINHFKLLSVYKALGRVKSVSRIYSAETKIMNSTTMRFVMVLTFGQGLIHACRMYVICIGDTVLNPVSFGAAGERNVPPQCSSSTFTFTAGSFSSNITF